MPLPGGAPPALFTAVNSSARFSSPIAYQLVLTTASIQILPQNLARLGVFFCNPNASGASLFICPALDHNGAPIAAGGAGSLLLLPGQFFTLSNACGCAWNGSCSLGTPTPFTAWEFIG